MSLLTARNEVFQLVKDYLDGAGAAPTKVLWPNVVAAKPDPVSDAAVSWCRVMFLPATSFKVGIGGNGSGMYRNEGVLVLELYYPTGDGHETVLTLMETARPALRRKRTASGVILRDATLTFVEEDGPWFHSNLTINFRYDEVG